MPGSVYTVDCEIDWKQGLHMRLNIAYSMSAESMLSLNLTDMLLKLLIYALEPCSEILSTACAQLCMLHKSTSCSIAICLPIIAIGYLF